MPKMFIDGKEYDFKPGQSVLQLAHEVGIDVPYFCYHPGLSVAGNCRMCLVEVEGGRKPDISCNMECKEGIKVQTQTDSVKKLQKGVMEFLLLNHPLDCPVCDQAGECWLQEYYMDFARHPSALRDHKTEKPKAQVLGPQVILDAERCILCTRCVRFLDEVTHSSELTIVNRGGHAEISLFPGERLENLYSSNTVDICPVGALTNREFRFKQRVWFLKSSESVCNLCSNGCNVHVEANAVERTAYRVKPRTNMDVNRWWMCDIGRGAHLPTNAATRVKLPRAGAGTAGTDAGGNGTWAGVGRLLKEKLRAFAPGSIALVGGPFSTNESLWALKRFGFEILGAKGAVRAPQVDLVGAADDFLLKADKTPNRNGAEAIFPGNDAMSLDALRTGIEGGAVKGLLVLEHDLVRLSKKPDETRALLSKLELLVVLSSQDDELAAMAHVLLPAATYLEMDGTFTNFSGRVQRVKPVFAPLHESRPAWAILDFLAEEIRGSGMGFGWNTASDVFAEMAGKLPAFAALTYEKIGDQGAMLAGRENVAPPAATSGVPTAAGAA